jgi:cobalt/nickel transport system permease protein
MANLAEQVFDIGLTDALAGRDTPVHRLDPRAKLLVTLFYCAVAVSFDRYTVSALIPLIAYPVFLCTVGKIPFSYIGRKILLVSPFALTIGIFNLLSEPQPVSEIFGITVSAGQVSFVSILLRLVLTVGAVSALAAVTGFYPLLRAAERLGVPRVLILQMMFFFRYLFVLVSEAVRMIRARNLRSFGARGMGLRSYGPLAGHLLLRTLSRAEKIYQAMNARGFSGEIRLLRPLRFRPADVVFVSAWTAFFVAARLLNIPDIIGRAAMELF